MKLKLKYVFLGIIFNSIFNSCVPTPSAPENNKIEDTYHNVAFILCEGLWNNNNSRLDKYLIDSSVIINDYYTFINNIKLGDTAYDIKRKGDTAFISVSTSKSIEIFNLKTGKFIDRIIVSTNSPLRNLTIYNDSNAYVSDLYQKQVICFNPTTFQIKTKIDVGPAPEGICNDDFSVFVANSGFGDYQKTLPKAGYISKIDTKTNTEIASVFCGNNIMQVHYALFNNKVYGIFINFPSLPDSLGGIVEFDATNMKRERQWRMKIIKAIISKNMLYFINKDGLFEINLLYPNSQAVQILKNTKDENWYGLQINPSETEIWICNAKNYQVKGEVLVFNINSKQVNKIIPTGQNPNNILFY